MAQHVPPTRPSYKIKGGAIGLGWFQVRPDFPFLNDKHPSWAPDGLRSHFKRGKELTSYSWRRAPRDRDIEALFCEAGVGAYSPPQTKVSIANLDAPFCRQYNGCIEYCMKLLRAPTSRTSSSSLHPIILIPGTTVPRGVPGVVAKEKSVLMLQDATQQSRHTMFTDNAKAQKPASSYYAAAVLRWSNPTPLVAITAGTAGFNQSNRTTVEY